MSSDPVYYKPEQLDKNKLTQALSGVVQNFVDGVTDGSIQQWGHLLNLKIEFKSIGPMAVARAIYAIKIGDDGVWVDGAKVASSTAPPAAITYAIMTALGVEALPAVPAILIGAAIGTAVTALWDYDFKELPAALIDPWFGTEDTRIEYIKGGETVSGVLFPNLDVISEPGQIRDLLSHFNGDADIGKLATGDTFSILKNGSSVTEYKVAAADLLEIAAANIGVDVNDVYDHEGAKFRDGTLGQNADVIMRDFGSGYSIYHEQSALGLSLEVKGQIMDLSVPIKNITWTGVLEGDNLSGGVHVYFGGAGESDDVISVLTAKDSVVFGGLGSDRIFGGSGDDTLYGDTEDKDATSGRDDELHGMVGIDHLYGGGGDDKLYGGLNDDVLNGGYGNDVLGGDEGVDILVGGEGSDKLVGGAADPLTAFDLGIIHSEWNDNTRDYLAGGAGEDNYYIFAPVIADWSDEDEDSQWTDYIGSLDLVSDVDFVAHYQKLFSVADFPSGIITFDLTDEQLLSAWSGSSFAEFTISTSFVNEPEWYDFDPELTIKGDLMLDIQSGKYFIALSASFLDTFDIGYFGGLYDINVPDPASLPRLDYMGSSDDDSVSGAAQQNNYYTGEGNDNITGGAGVDNGYAGNGADVFDGGAGNDFASGGAGNDTLRGGNDNDVLSGDSGDDLVDGGNGEDIAKYSGSYYRYIIVQRFDGTLSISDSQDIDGVDTLSGIEFARFAESGNDVNLGSLSVVGNSIYGTEYSENITGTTGRDGIIGYSGSDTIDGGAGDDSIFGGDGDDDLRGGSGNDSLEGGAGIDVIDGGAGLDVAQFYGYQEFYVITYLSNGTLFVTDTQLEGSTDELKNIESIRIYSREVYSVDVNSLVVQGGGIYGTDSDEYIGGTEVGDVVIAGAGNDDIEAGGGDDRIFGGAGNDSISGGTGNNLIDGGEGQNDSIDYSWAPGKVYISLKYQYGYRDLSQDKLISIENARGSDFDDQIEGSDGDNNLFGSLGVDELLGVGGNDSLDGGAGNDILDGGEGDDQLHGGDGDDAIDGGDGTNDWVTYWDAGSVTVNLTDGTATGQGTDAIANIENIWGSAGNDSLTGNGQDNGLFGADGNDFIWGVDGFNTLNGGAGDDDIVSGHGNDVIEGGEGTDTVEYWWSTSGVTVSLADGMAHGDGDDTISGVENLVGSSFDDSLTGNEVDNQIYGDTGNDNLSGFAGNDYLNAGEGNDILNGGVGDDYLEGGAGSDTFHFDPNFGHDKVGDFSAGDVIEFAHTVFADFTEVIEAATEVDGSTVITLDGDNSVTLENVALASLSADEFRFAA